MFPYLTSSDKNKYMRKDTLPGLNCKISQSVLEKIPNKGTSPRLSASATVEAVCILPFVLFFFISVIWMIDLFYIHSEVQNVVNETGNSMVAYSYPYEFFMKGDSNKEIIKLALQAGWKEGHIRNEISKLSISDKISQLTSLLSNMKDGEIDIVVTYYVEPYLALPGMRGVFLTNHYYSKAYTGYNRNDTVSDEMVYITRTGSVYHTCLDCTALKVTLSEIAVNSVEKQRNESGSKYYPCNYCNASESDDFVYITPFGNRYHSSPNCYQLDIDIFEVPLSLAEGRRLCKYCEKGED